MSYLTQRAEQAMLGALLNDDSLLRQLGTDIIDPDQLGSRAHREVLRALQLVASGEPIHDPAERLEEVARYLVEPGTDLAWLERLRDQAGPQAHIPAYARMLEAAALRREIADRVEEIQAEAYGEDPVWIGVARNVEAHRNLTADHPDQTATPFAAAQIDTPGPSPAQIPEFTQMNRADYEDVVIADLIRHPEQWHDLAWALPDEHFSTDQRRAVYQTVLELASEEQPIDAVLVAHRLERNIAYERATTGAIPPTPAEPDLVYLDRVGRSPETTLSATEAAQYILAEDFRAGIAGLNHRRQQNSMLTARENLTHRPTRAGPYASPDPREMPRFDPRTRPQPPTDPGPERRMKP